MQNTALTYMPERELLGLMPRLSNENRWGTDDQLGTLNFITPAKRVEAARLVREGRSVSIAKDLISPARGQGVPGVIHRMLFAGDSVEADLGLRDRQTIPISTLDVIEIAPHGESVTHLDAFGHTNFEGQLYNGRRAAEVVSGNGLKQSSVFEFREGILTRGVLLDITRVRDVNSVSPGDGITPDDLEMAEVHAGVKVAQGDALLVHTGAARREQLHGKVGPKERTGLMPECLAWLHDREVAVYSGDCVERFDAPYERLPLYFHMICLAVMGLPILDNPNLQPLLSLAGELGRYEFMFTCAALRLPGATGSAVNPLCVF